MFLLILAVFFTYTLLPDKNIPQNQPAPAVIINGQIINVEIADKPAEQIQGLSDRENLAENSGMLFIFENKQIRNFWMKNMHFPLDIIWISDNNIVNISQNLPPEKQSPKNNYSSKQPVNYVLEINAGMVEKYKIKIGDNVKFK
ncbi:MAG: DUF192 domain-containing protein [Patescibacteria group bacterium]|nr:DUF192 domain-containing protein [Patescibacteria group bacterium]